MGMTESYYNTIIYNIDNNSVIVLNVELKQCKS